MVIIVFGLPGSGKSTFAQALAGRLKAYYFSTDRIRKMLITDPEYSAAEKVAVYDRMLQLATAAVVTYDDDVVLDGTFHRSVIRRLFKKGLGERTAVYFIEIRSREELIRERLAYPREDSDADFSVYEKVRAEWEAGDEEHLVLWSEQDNVDELLMQAFDYIHILYERPPYS